MASTHDSPESPLPREHAGRRVLVTGAASGIGLAIARAFSEAGARLILLDRDGERLSSVARELGAELALAARVDREDEVLDAFSQIDKALGGPDVLVNNAGVAANKPSLDLTGDDWRACMGVNLDGVFFCSREAGRRMVAQGSGVILNLASLYAVLGGAERLAYAASKSAVAMMTKVLAVEWAERGVRVNALAPGYIATPFLEKLFEQGRLERSGIEARTPMGRLGRPEEVADLALFLASDRAAYITGQVVGVDGGWTANGFQRTGR